MGRGSQNQEAVREEFTPVFLSRKPLVPRRRWSTVVLAAGVCLAVVATAGGAYVLTQRGRTTEIGLDDVVSRFREEPPSSGPARATEQAPADVDAGDAGSTAPLGGPEIRSPEAPPPLAPDPYARPAEGVYGYRTSGGEQVSMLGGRHDYPERTYATIRHLEDGCMWEHRNDVVREHVDILHLCSRPGAFEQNGQERQVEFFGIRDGNAFYCNPPVVLHQPSESPGHTVVFNCSDSGEGTLELARRLVGREHVLVGDKTVDAVRLLLEGTFTGPVTGTSTDELWLSPETGLILRWKRSVDSVARSFGARVRYTENATFDLESLDPRV